MNIESEFYEANSSDLPRQPIVVLKNVSKSFRRRQIIDSANLTVYHGEFVAIRGRSGSGKSTLLNLIGLLDKADSGEIILFGDSIPKIGSSRASKILRKKLAYLFQNAALIDQDTVEANLKIAQKYSLTLKPQRAEERASALAAVGLSGMEKQKVYELSGGEQQRLSIACLFMHPSELILADEPTGSLDPENRNMILSMLENLRNEQGKTVIVVTHDSVVADAADRTIVLDD